MRRECASEGTNSCKIGVSDVWDTAGANEIDADEALIRMGARNEEGDRRMMHPDHYYFLMSLLRYGALGLGLIFAVRLIAFLFHYMSWASLA